MAPLNHSKVGDKVICNGFPGTVTRTAQSPAHLFDLVAQGEAIHAQLSVPIRKDDGLCARPAGPSADEWNVWLSEWRDAGHPFVAVQIAEAIEENVCSWRALAEERFAEIERARAIIEEQKAFRESVLTDGLLADLLAALRKIAEGRGRFSTDQLTFASNTIDDMKELALAAIAKATGGAS